MKRSENVLYRQWRSIAGLILIGAMGSPAVAQSDSADDLQFDGLVELRGVVSDLDFNEGEGIDTSGIGARVRLGSEYAAGSKTEIRGEIEARHFRFRDDTRDSLETFIGRVQVTHQLSDEVQIAAYARRFENITVLEALQADQTSAGASAEWERGNDRFSVSAEYRARQYDTTVPGKGDGYRVAAQYNRRFGSYHWLRLDVRHEDMQSDNAPRRSFNRQVAQIKYSLPVTKRLRVRPSLEYRQWDYDARIARGDPDGGLRKDSYIAPAVELSWGRTSGPYALASLEYRLRDSNDTRFDNDAIRAGLMVGFRF